MKQLVVLLCIIIGMQSSFADVPTVPNNIEFAGLTLKLSDKARKKIQAEVNALTRNPKYFQIKVDRIQIYFPIIERIFMEEGLPEDFKYLVLQESALISDAVSSSNAVGFWQFKKAAATEVGLRVDKNVDERLNIVSSTRGAAKYIQKNNRIFFDNWVHALLAYQQGPGGAQKLVNKKYRGSNSMPIDSRTHWYVIKFLAHKIAFEQVKSSAPELYLLEYYEGQGKTIKDISELKSLEFDLMQRYNKWLKRGRVPGDKPYAVMLPYPDNSGILVASGMVKSSAPDVQRQASNIEYETHPTKYPIIKTYTNRKKGIKVNGIRAVRIYENTDLKSLENSTGVSKKRLVYYNDVAAGKQPKSGELWYLKPKRSKSREAHHIVESSENLWMVSQKYGIKLNQLRKKNRIPKNQTTVKQGRVLWLSETRPSGSPVAYVKVVEPAVPKESVPDNHNEVIQTKTGNRTQQIALKTTKSHETLEPDKKEESDNLANSVQKVHEVQSGESLYGISKKYGTTVEDLRAWNNLDGSSLLSIGQILKISGDKLVQTKSTPPSKAKETGFTVHKVQAGESLYKIARDYNTTIKQLMEWNKKSDFDLSIGEEIKVLQID